jgi:putative N-acetyltransferase (TIGR04045 family)
VGRTASFPSSRAPVRTRGADARPLVSCRLAESAEDHRAHLAIRHEVFVVEQRIFPVSDEDERDGHALSVLGLCEAQAAGAVRLYPLEDSGLWKGDRLAVLPGFRGCRVAAPLVRFAVATAAVRGAHTMLAQVQTANVSFFTALGWRPDGPEERYVGLPHQPMAIELVDAEAPGAAPPPADLRSRGR